MFTFLLEIEEHAISNFYCISREYVELFDKPKFKYKFIVFSHKFDTLRKNTMLDRIALYVRFIFEDLSNEKLSNV